MNSERFRQVERVYLLALEAEERQRAAVLDEACAGDADLRRDVEAMLSLEPRVEAFLADPPWLGASAREPEGPASQGAVSQEASSVPPPVDAEGLFAGRYRIVRLLGHGGMGVVYQAEDTRLKRFVALKFLGASLSADPSARTRFLREAQAAAALDDPHVCTIYEAGEDQGRAYLAMALIDGPSLKERIAQGALAIDEAIGIAHDVAAGLAAAHARGIVHRDIKPGNVLLAGDGRARVTDFGVARIEGGHHSTKTAGVIGTPAYMSPEQVRGLPTDHRTDIWSLGCVMYEMLTGRPPFSTTGGQPDVFAIVQGTALPVTAFRPDAPTALAAIVDRCLRPDLHQRYDAAASVVADLESLAPGFAVSGARAARRDPPSIAVLPFADMSPDRSQDYFAEGIAEELIHALARIDGLRVAARTSSFALKGRGLEVREIGRLLNVEHVLEGSVRGAQGRLRITAQLVTACDGFHVWSERFDRDAGDVFAIQDEITASIVDRLAVAPRLGERAALAKRAPVDPEAYALFLKGRYFENRIAADTVELALRFYGEAIAKDPAFARAHAGVGSVWESLAAFNLMPPAQAWPKAREAAERALALDPDVAEAHLVLGGIAMWYDWDWVAAESAMTRALALNPGDAWIRGHYAWLLLTRCRFEECAAEIRHALACDPLSPILYAFAIGLHGACRRGEEALEEFRRAVEIAPSFGLAYFHAAVAYTSLGRLDEAADVVEAGIRKGLTVFWADCILGIVRARQGRHEDARLILARMIEQHERLDVSSASIAWVAACLGDYDTAFEWLEHGYREHDGLMAWVHVYTDLFVPDLAGDPRFDSLLERMRLTDVAASLRAESQRSRA